MTRWRLERRAATPRSALPLYYHITYRITALLTALLHYEVEARAQSTNASGRPAATSFGTFKQREDSSLLPREEYWEYYSSWEYLNLLSYT